MIRSFIYLDEIVEDKDDILWFPSGLKREFSPHFAQLLASLWGEQRGVEWVTLTHGREILECSGGRDISDQVWLLFGRSSANTLSFLAPCIDPIFLTRLHLPSVYSLSKCCAVSSWYGGYLCVCASSSGYIAGSWTSGRGLKDIFSGVKKSFSNLALFESTCPGSKRSSITSGLVS